VSSTGLRSKDWLVLGYSHVALANRPLCQVKTALMVVFSVGLSDKDYHSRENNELTLCLF